LLLGKRAGLHWNHPRFEASLSDWLLLIPACQLCTDSPYLLPSEIKLSSYKLQGY
jgi:hypothetical protein